MKQLKSKSETFYFQYNRMAQLSNLDLFVKEVILKRIDLSEYTIYHEFISNWWSSIVADNRYKIALNKPITLPRILVALGKRYAYEYWNIVWLWDYDCIVWKRKLLNPNNSDATFFDQDENTKQKIAQLLWYK